MFVNSLMRVALADRIGFLKLVQPEKILYAQVKFNSLHRISLVPPGCISFKPPVILEKRHVKVQSQAYRIIID